MISDKKTLTEVTIELDLEFDQSMQFHSDFPKMKDKSALARLCENYEPFLPFVIEIIEQFRLLKLDKTEVSIISEFIKDKKALEHRIQYLRHEINLLSFQ